MSLRSIHILFIVTALGLVAFLGYWSGLRVWNGENSMSMPLAVASLIGLALGIPYLGWFVKKTKSLE